MLYQDENIEVFGKIEGVSKDKSNSYFAKMKTETGVTVYLDKLSTSTANTLKTNKDYSAAGKIKELYYKNKKCHIRIASPLIQETYGNPNLLNSPKK